MIVSDDAGQFVVGKHALCRCTPSASCTNSRSSPTCIGLPSNVYGEREIALALLAVLRDSVVTARANTAFGERQDAEWTEDGPIAVHRSEKGLVITEILSTKPSKA